MTEKPAQPLTVDEALTIASAALQRMERGSSTTLTVTVFHSAMAYVKELRKREKPAASRDFGNVKVRHNVRQPESASVAPTIPKETPQ